MRPPEITFIVTYRCPGCQATLESRAGEGPGGWLRCPRCGQSSLPPDTERLPRPNPILPGDDVLVIGPVTTTDRSQEPGHFKALERYPGSVRRVTMAAGLLVSFGLLIMALDDGHVVRVAIFGAITLLLIMSLVAPIRRL